MVQNNQGGNGQHDWWQAQQQPPQYQSYPTGHNQNGIPPKKNNGWAWGIGVTVVSLVSMYGLFQLTENASSSDSTYVVPRAEKMRIGVAEENILNSVEMIPAPTSCDVPNSYDPANKATSQILIDNMVKCLEASWRLVSEQVVEPRYIQPLRKTYVVNDPSKDPFTCLPTTGEVSFYCAGGWEMTIRTDLSTTIPALARVVSHEFGHHVQANAGILDGTDLAARRAYKADVGNTDGYAAPEGGRFLPLIEKEPEKYSPNERLVKRRMEAQAECYAGMGIAAAFPAVRAAAMSDYAHATRENPPEEDHPSPANGALWLERGFDAQSMADCNTWVAPVSEIE